MKASRPPSATYRIQFTRNFTFSAARTLVAYLSDLGITDLYTSPISHARRGSLHGYSVTNPTEIDPKLGTRSTLDSLANKLKSRAMGLIIDIVPNHMALSRDNPWWMDVLESGQGSPYAVFFDIDWHPPSKVLEGKVLLPVLGKYYSEALEAREFELVLEEGGFSIRYFDLSFPLDPKSYAQILTLRLEELEKTLGEADPAVLGVKGLVSLCELLPARWLTSRKKVRERQRLKEILKKSLWLLYQTTATVAQFLDENLKIFNGGKQIPASLDPLDRLLCDQPYRLAFWKVALEMINYRRFFSINDLIGIRMEDEQVFEALSHGVQLDLVAEGKISGTRIDHIDGLYNPQEYLLRLRSAMSEVSRQTGLTPHYIVVEKILAQGESLPEKWPISGTTGYDHLNMVNGLFVDRRGYRRLEKVYAAFTATESNAADIIYDRKKMVMETLFGGEVENLTFYLGLLAYQDRQARDLSKRDMTKSLVEVTACLSVYRTYINSYEICERDRESIEQALSEVGQRNPSLNPMAIGFMRRLMLMDFPTYLSVEQKNERLNFVMRWQQFTGPIMAKGCEDTALYVYNPLISLNEVGASFKPVSIEEFHDFNSRRQQLWPHTMNATSTHDTKRSEDVRARINTLSEIVEEWEDLLERWKILNAPHKVWVDGAPVPDANEEVFLYQTLIGAWPLQTGEIPAFGRRLKAYMVKAVREAKVHTTWTAPNNKYEDGLLSFCDSILSDSVENEFLANFLRAHSRLAYCGAINSLSQLLLKIGSPGVPDFYQGSELWDFRLVDPDNRRPVEFRKRVRLLKELRKRESKNQDGLITELLVDWEDGRIKLYVAYKALNFRRKHREIFLEGDYIPLGCSGPREKNVVAFLRKKEDFWILVAVPRFTAKLGATGAPTGKRVWGESFLTIPPEAPVTWTHVFTGQPVEGEGGRLSLKQIFARFPVALLWGGEIAKAGS
ncbi:MAG: malto-oligosyltrehalose synthase [Syntrophobacteraceae bacterium]